MKFSPMFPEVRSQNLIILQFASFAGNIQMDEVLFLKKMPPTGLLWIINPDQQQKGALIFRSLRERGKGTPE
jgi:hypothetical protein